MCVCGIVYMCFCVSMYVPRVCMDVYMCLSVCVCAYMTVCIACIIVNGNLLSQGSVGVVHNCMSLIVSTGECQDS